MTVPAQGDVVFSEGGPNSFATRAHGPVAPCALFENVIAVM